MGNKAKYALALLVLIAGAALAVSQLTASTSVIYGQATVNSSTAGTGSNGVTRPGALAVDNSGRLLACDLADSRVLIYANGIGATNETMALFALSRSNDTGAAGPTFTSGGTPLEGELATPSDVAYYKGSYAQFVAVVDDWNRVLIWVWAADSTYNQVLNKNATGETLPAIVIGQRSFTAYETDSALSTGSDSLYSLAARFATSVTFGASSSGDTVFLFVSTDTGSNEGSHRVYRFALRDSFLHNVARSSNSGTGRETAVLSYPASRASGIPTPFGQAPKADVIYGLSGTNHLDTAIGVSQTRFSQIWDLSFYSSALYVADRGNNRVVAFNSANAAAGSIDTTADVLWGQRTWTASEAWATGAGSDTGLRLPASLSVTSGGVAVGDSPSILAGGRVIVFDGHSDTAADRWFGVDPYGNTLSSGTASASILSGAAPQVVGYSSTVLAADEYFNRILVLSNALSPSATTARADDDDCVISRTVGNGFLSGIQPSLRGMRDAMLESSVGRFLVSGYYGFALLLMAAGAVLGISRR